LTLADLRKLAVKKTARIRFVLPNGMEGAVDEHGIARVPSLNRQPDFNLARDIEQVGEFLVEWRADLDKKGMPKRQTFSRADLESMTKADSGAAAAAHEEE
jgi:hypothetical protein